MYYKLVALAVASIFVWGIFIAPYSMPTTAQSLPAAAQSFSGLTDAQIRSIIDLLDAFGANQGTINEVENALRGTTAGSDAPPVRINSFAVNPQTVSAGEGVLFSWGASNAGLCNLYKWDVNGNRGLIRGDGPAVGTWADSPLETTKYELVCYDKNIDNSVSRTVVVSVENEEEVVVDARANGSKGPITINAGESFTISWNSRNATSCGLENSLATGEDKVETSGSVTYTSDPNVTYTVTTTYVVTCKNASGDEDEDRVIVRAIPSDSSVSTPTLTSPESRTVTPGSTETFAWTAVSGATQYWIYVGTSQGSKDILSKNLGQNRGASVELPGELGSDLWVRAWYQKADGAWEFTDFEFANAGGSDSPDSSDSSNVPQLTAPQPGSTLSGSTQTFSWKAVNTASQYWLYVGTSKGDNDILSRDMGTSLSTTVSGLPTNGETLWVRVWANLGSWVSRDFQLTAAGSAAEGDTEVTAPDLLTPQPGATLTGSVQRFEFEDVGAVQYWIYVGTGRGEKDIASRNMGVERSITVSNLPTNGETLWVRAWASDGSNWHQRDYQLTAFGSRTNGGSGGTTSLEDSDTQAEAPKGFLDTASCSVVTGWACDPDNFSESIEVHIYDGIAGSGGGTLLGSVVANQERSDVAGVCGGTTSHGFSFTVPDSIKDGEERNIFAYGIDDGRDGGTGNPLLTNAKTITCSPPATSQTDATCPSGSQYYSGTYGTPCSTSLGSCWTQSCRTDFADGGAYGYDSWYAQCTDQDDTRITSSNTCPASTSSIYLNNSAEENSLASLFAAVRGMMHSLRLP